MVISERNKKSPEEIKKSILIRLNKGPQTAQDIALEINSNWKTVKEYLKKLVEDKEVKEIIATEKISYYKRTAGDTYFDLPLSEKQREKFRTLFYLIKECYKAKNKHLNKTHLAKCAVHLIKDEDIKELKELPVIWYLYGAIPQMILNEVENATEEYSFNEKSQITQKINNYIAINGDKNAEQLQKEQHQNYRQKVYCIIDELFSELNKSKINKENINNLLSSFFVECPVDPDFPEIFDLSEEVISTIDSLVFLEKDLEKHRKDILTTIDSLWKFIALYYLYISKIEANDGLDKNILLNFYIGEALEDRKRVLIESLSELKNKYNELLSKIDISKIKLSKEAKEVAKIMEDFI